MGTIDEYLETLDPGDAAVIAHCYDVARELVPTAEQGVGYGMPTLTYAGKPLLSVMRTKNHFGLYPFSGKVVAAHAAELAQIDHSTGTVRFKAEKPLPDGLLRSLVAARQAEIEG